MISSVSTATAPMIPAPAMSDAVFALTLALLLLAPLAIAGVALINAGLGRSRSAAQALLGNLALGAVAALVFALVGASFAGTLGTAMPPFTPPEEPGACSDSGRFCCTGWPRPRRRRSLRSSSSSWPSPWRR